MSNQLAAVTTPPRGFAPLAAILNGQTVPALLARWGLKLSRCKRRPLKLGKFVIAARHCDVTEMLRRDLDFLIAPINAKRIEAVNGGRFILGMDRSPAQMLEHDVLYAALAKLDMATIAANVNQDAQRCIMSAGASFDAIADYARPVAAATASRVFGICPDNQPLFKEAVRAIFAHTFLNLSGDKAIEARALAAAPLMRGWFKEEISRRERQNALGDDLMGQLLRDGRLDQDAVRRTLGGMLVGSIDTTVSTFARVFTVISTEKRLRGETLTAWAAGKDIYGYCLDALRCWPHNPIIIRQSAANTTLGGVQVPAGTTVVAWTQAAMQDPEAFPNPDRMLPDRLRNAYLHFGGGLHPCAGRALNAIQIPALVGTLLAAGGEIAGTMKWAGPFPNHLPARLAKRSGG